MSGDYVVSGKKALLFFFKVSSSQKKRGASSEGFLCRGRLGGRRAAGTVTGPPPHARRAATVPSPRLRALSLTESETTPQKPKGHARPSGGDALRPKRKEALSKGSALTGAGQRPPPPTVLRHCCRPPPRARGGPAAPAPLTGCPPPGCWAQLRPPAQSVATGHRLTPALLNLLRFNLRGIWAVNKEHSTCKK